jgi:ketosteroid isomerase-like protein
MNAVNDARDERLNLVRTWMTTLGEPAWWSLMHEDIVLEFPYGPSLGQPGRIAGRSAAVTYVKALLDRAGKIEFFDLEILPTSDPELFVCEYRSNRKNRGGQPYVQIYINKVRVKDGKVALMREFWDPKRIVEASAHPST